MCLRQRDRLQVKTVGNGSVNTLHQYIKLRCTRYSYFQERSFRILNTTEQVYFIKSLQIIDQALK